MNVTDRTSQKKRVNTKEVKRKLVISHLDTVDCALEKPNPLGSNFSSFLLPTEPYLPDYLFTHQREIT